MKKLLSLLIFISISFAAICQTTTVTLKGTLVSKAVDATSMTYLWTQVSGSTVTITSPTSLTTTLTNVGTGTYKFQLVGTDNFGVKSLPSFTNVTVNRGVVIPVVDAGADQTITLGSTGFLFFQKPEVNSAVVIK